MINNQLALLLLPIGGVSMQLYGARILLDRPAITDFPAFWELLNDAEARKYTGGITQLSYDARYALY